MTEKERTLIAKTHEHFGTCLTNEMLKNDLQKLGVSSGMTLLVHCSLSKIGWICGGPVTVIQVLLDLLGPEGTLIMPSHTSDNSDPKYWVNPPVPSEWLDVIRKSMPPYQPDIAPTRYMGILAETFRKWPCVLRSEHPQHSMMALGVKHGNNTSLHLAEYRFFINNNFKKNFLTGASIINRQTNTRQWFEWNDYDHTADDFNDIGNAFEAIEGNANIGNVGLAPSRLMKQYLVVDFALQWMNKNRTKQ
ncbi:unnamed protein product [Rotaria sordida]|uniref:Aminoglycoside N(3)-acetyltransferase n=1 Tax=Rotaria sordida TaxID=392033 RepID=A0A819P3B5_9BILA|nr:unnamed protein product [Rotaria sordida]